MFSGIVSDIGSITESVDRGGVRQVSIACAYAPPSIEIGASIACSGICLTATGVQPSSTGATFTADLGPETLAVTNASGWQVGTRVNLERSLRMGDELSGHLVSGHVDGVAAIVAREDMGETVRFTFEAPAALGRFIAAKGSVALDGTSLTVNTVDRNRFTCHLIPHTLAVTTWGSRKAGDTVNLEVDVIARYVARLREAD